MLHIPYEMLLPLSKTKEDHRCSSVLDRCCWGLSLRHRDIRHLYFTVFTCRGIHGAAPCAAAQAALYACENRVTKVCVRK